jgi:phage gp46-like protein
LDVALRHTPDGGEIDFVNGVLAMDDGPWTAVYISLFGGNEDDSGSDGDKSKQWWANFEEKLEERKLRSETQYLLNTVPLTPGNRKRFEDSAIRDLEWMASAGLVTFVGVVARITAVNRLQIDVTVELDGKQFTRSFTPPVSQ